MRFLAVAVLCLLSASAQEKPKSAFDKPTFETYVRHLLLVDPRVQISIDDPKLSPMPSLKEIDVHMTFQGRSQDEVFYATNNGQEVFYGKVFNINQSPFASDIEKIHTDKAPSFGTPGAPITIVLYSDFECPACREEAKTLRENVAKTYPTQVVVYFKDFPLTEIHPWAKTAAIAGRWFYDRNPQTFWDFYDWVYEHQSEITAANVNDKLLEFAKSKNLDTLQLSRALETKSAETEIDKEVAEGHALKIDQTPTMFINGRRIPGSIPWQNLNQLLDAELQFAKANPAADKCCEVKIPTALSR